MSILTWVACFASGGLLVLLCGLLYFATRGPRGVPCALEGCDTLHWNTEKFCSHHILDEYEEEHWIDSGPG